MFEHFCGDLSKGSRLPAQEGVVFGTDLMVLALFEKRTGVDLSG
jgi:hypothetical protein